jgi:hypothetical protein
MRQILLAGLVLLGIGEAFAQAPTVTTPGVTTTNPGTPTVSPPTVNGPTVNTPTVNGPTVNTPTIGPTSTPAAPTPTVSTPAPTIQTPTVGRPNLSGEWEGAFGLGNYQQQTERVRVVQQGATLTATKITGDDFFPAGQVTLIAEVTGRMFAGSQQGAERGFVNARWFPVTVTLLDDNTLRIDGPGGADWPVAFWRRVRR